MKKIAILFAIIVISLVIIGCAPKQTAQSDELNIDTIISELNEIDSELDSELSDLDSLDQELADLESLDLG